MSGHSKWHKIKHQKEATDKKKGQVFGKFAREIVTAARHEKDPAKNATLRDIIVKAKKANMPQENIDRLLSGSDKPLTAATYEGFGPGGIAILILTETDNSNRTVNELRLIFKNNNGALGQAGSVAWKFHSTYQFLVSTQHLPLPIDELELLLIDNGANDFSVQENMLEISTAPENQRHLKKALQEKNIPIEAEALTYLSQETVSPNEKDTATLHLLLQEITAHADVIDIYHNSSLQV